MSLQQSQSQALPNPAERILTRADAVFVVILIFWTLALNGLGLGELEFFRHTEADRTLIGWEMYESRNFLVPHLLHSEILTKPPLFYWCVAAAIWLFASVEEWVARLPSFCISVLFVALQYLFLRIVGCSKFWSFASALFLSTSLAFMVKATVAEIDILFSFLCTFALYSGFLSTLRSSLSCLGIAYALSALAFLTKGPPILLFFGVSHLLFYVYCRFFGKAHSLNIRLWSIPRFLWLNLVGSIFFLILLLCWLVPLANEVGWFALSEQVRVELLERVFSDRSRSREPFFYLSSLVFGLIPWSFFLLIAIGFAGIYRRRSIDFFRGLLPEYRSLLVFSLFVVSSAICILSFSEGKSGRYLFPIQAFAVNLCMFSALFLRENRVEGKLFAIGKLIGFGGVPVALLIPCFLDFEGVSSLGFWSTAIVMALSVLLLGIASYRKEAFLVLGSIAIIMLAVRFGQYQMYAPHRNTVRTVKPIVEAIDNQLPARTPIYTLEMFERWVSYYLKRKERETYRLTPQLVEALRSSDSRVALLLTLDEEYWRLLQLGLYDPSYQIKGVYANEKMRLVLLDVSTDVLPYLRPRALFPTKSTKPFTHNPPLLRWLPLNPL